MSKESSESRGDGGGIDADEQRQVVRERYGSIASTSSSCCGGSDETVEVTEPDDSESSSSSCCGDDGGGETDLEELSRQLGYSEAELEQVLGDANLGLGCGNPTAIAGLEPGETVLDLGSGGGFDCFLAADAVGPEGRVIGVDMTPEMVETARENARANDAANVEFRLGEIEALPVADETVDVIISNCVVNLSPDKPRVFREAFRVLRPGGRLAITDVVLTAELPVDIQGDPDSVASCVAGASWIEELEAMLAEAGFEGIEIEPKEDSEEFIEDWDAERDLSEFIVSARIEGKKPV